MNKCGNERHPNGAWHDATPLPGSWQWLARFRYWLNRRRWGCGCDRKMRWHRNKWAVRS